MAAGSSAADRNKTVNRQVCGRQKKHRGWYRQLDPPTAVCKRQQKHRGRYRQLDPSTAVCNASKNIAAGANNLSRRQHSLVLNPNKKKAGKCYYLGSGSKCMVNGVFCMVPNFVSRYRFFCRWYRKVSSSPASFIVSFKSELYRFFGDPSTNLELSTFFG